MSVEMWLFLSSTHSSHKLNDCIFIMGNSQSIHCGTHKCPSIFRDETGFIRHIDETKRQIVLNRLSQLGGTSDSFSDDYDSYSSSDDKEVDLAYYAYFKKDPDIRLPIDSFVLEDGSIPSNMPASVSIVLKLKVPGGFSDIYYDYLDDGSSNMLGPEFKRLIYKKIKKEPVFEFEKNIFDKLKIVDSPRDNFLRLLAKGVLTPVGVLEQEQILIFPYCIDKDLTSYNRILGRHSDQDMRNIFDMVRSLLETVRFLHVEKGIVHCDIKPSNVFVSCHKTQTSSVPSLYLADFGLAIFLGEEDAVYLKGKAGTENFFDLGSYYPKEKLFRVSRKTDIWALGLVILFLLIGEVPHFKTFQHLEKTPDNIQDIYFRGINGLTQHFDITIFSKSIQEMIQRLVNELVLKMVEIDFEKRYDIEKCIETFDEITQSSQKGGYSKRKKTQSFSPYKKQYIENKRKYLKIKSQLI